MSAHQNDTVDWYNKHASEWAAKHQPSEKSYWEYEIRLLTKLAPSGKIIDIGCGAGLDAPFLSRYYSYTGIDPSAEFIKIAKTNFPTGQFIVSDLFSFIPEFPYDLFYSAAVLHHFSPSEIIPALEKIKSVIKPGGFGFISIANKESIITPDERTIVAYSQDEFSKILGETKYKIVHSGIHPAKNTWLYFIVQTPS